MQRMARAVPLARLRVDHLLNNVCHAPPARWPRHLRLARQILERRLAEGLALDVLARSVAAACQCAQAIDRLSLLLARAKIDDKAAAAFGLVANCIRRVPARLRQHLDDVIAAVRWHEPIDTEVITNIIEAAIAPFSAHPDCEPARTALAVLTVVDDFDTRGRHLGDDYSALSWQTRSNVEAALSALRSTGTPTAAVVFATMASAARAGGSDRRDRGIHALIVDYVVEVADIWRSAGLRPTRVFNPSYAEKRSKFHRFVDLVLTAMVEPWSRRYDNNLDMVKQQILAALARIPESDRGELDAALRRCDSEWLVSDDHLKKVLRKPVQKSRADTP